MSNSLAVSAVTATLRQLLSQGTRDNPPNTAVTARPPDRARANSTTNQLNIFLYHTTLSAAWRNMDMPRQVKPGETGAPPLPLNLYYLLTAYGENDEDALGHLVLGRAMSVLHDHPVISPQDIRLALPQDELRQYDLQNQREGIRITYQPLTLEEMSKLWTTFQTQYRISAAYQISVILIESSRPARTPLPVLRQGDAGRGPVAQPDLTPAFPTLLEVLPPDPGYSAELGDKLKLVGHHLTGDQITVCFRHRTLTDPNTLSPLPGATGTELEVQLPNDAAAAASWPAGGYDVWVQITRTVAGEQEEQMTNELHLALAPRIGNIAPNPAPRTPTGDVDLTLTFTPELRLAAGQTASLLIGDREVAPPPPPLPPAQPPSTTSSLTFRVRQIRPGDHFVRLRIDGVDSDLVDHAADPPAFDNAQKVTIQ